MKRINTLLRNVLLVASIASLHQMNSQVLVPQTNQQVEKCGSDQIHQRLLQTDPSYAVKMQQYESYVQSAQTNLNRTQSVIYKVPVVVNVMHKGEAVGVGTNVSDAAIQNAIKLMNQMYRKVAGTAWDGTGVDVEIEYVLAVRDPNGNCTNGINRISMTGNAAYMSDGVNRDATAGISDASLKVVYSWDPTKYYNIWLVSEIDNNEGGAGYQGYAYFAASHGSSVDGAVILSSNFTSGTSTTAAHEIGHSLNLFHTFEGDGTGSTCPSQSNGCGSGVGDCCGDIPAHKRSPSDCTAGTNACDGTTSRDLFIHNYMDYSSDLCQNMLTANQKTRMISSISTTRASFLGPDNGGTNMGLVPVSTAGVDFESSASILCGTGQSVTFTDRSSCTPNSYIPSSSFSGITHSWTITNGTNVYTSSAQNPTITFTNTGTYNVSLSVTNGNGTTSLTKTGMIVVTSGAPVSGCTPTTNNAGNYWQTIYNTSFNTFSNTTSKYINAGYSNIACAYNTIVTAGNAYKLSISANAEGGSGNEAFEVYIDYNNDGVFTNPSEMIFSGVATASTSATYTTNITIPGTAVQNTLLRMRVIGETGSIIAAERTCSSALFVGDVEDYGVYIKPAACTAPTITGTTPNSRCGTGTVTLSATASAGTVNWYTAATGGTAIATGTVYTTPSLTATTIYYVDATNAGCTTSSRTAVTATVTSVVVPSITVAITSGANPTCTGSSVTFSATPTNGGTTPTYQWKVNGGNVGTASTYASSALTNGQIVTCVLTSNAACAAPTTATSSAVTMTVNATVVPSIIIAQTVGTNPKCSGASSTFTATPTNGGTTPTYQWKVNGGNVGTNSPTYTTTTITNGQSVACVLTSNATCAAPTTATSSAVTMTVNSTVVPSIVIAQTAGTNPLCTGSAATFTATPTNGGSTPAYQWKVNGGNVGSNSPTYTTSSLTNGQSVTCMLTSNATCASTTTANSSAITMTVNSSVTPAVSIALSSGSNPTCVGSSITFSANPSNGGTTPAYQWQVDGVNTGSNTATFTSASLTDGQVVTCILTSNSSCASVPTATSSAVTMTVNTSPTIHASASSTIICSGSTTTLTASGGTSYSWNTGATTSAISVSPTTGTAYTVTGTLAGCSSTDIVTISVNSLPNVSISGTSTLCAGTSSVLTASGATSYLWNAGATTATLSVSPSSLTVYTITGTDASGCVNTATCSVNPITCGVAETATTSVPCGLGVYNMNISSSAANVSGAVQYRFNFYNNTTNVLIASKTQASRTFTFNSVSGLYYGNTYKWTVAVDKGIGFGPESSNGCTVVFNAPITNLPCGNSFSNLNVTGAAQAVYGATGYRFSFYDNSTNALVATKTQASNTINFSTVSGLNYGYTYRWRVEVQYNNGSTLLYGPASTTSLCTITFNAPQTTLPCGNTYPSASASVGFPAVGTASYYRVTFYDATTNALVGAKVFGTNYVYFNQVPGLVYNTTYKWTVEVYYNNGSGNVYGTPSSNNCLVTWGSAGSIVINQGGDIERLMNDQEDMDGQPIISVYPNPNNGVFIVTANKNMSITIVNEFGQIVRTQALDQDNNYEINIKELSNGIYFLTGQTPDNHVIRQKIIVSQ